MMLSIRGAATVEESMAPGSWSRTMSDRTRPAAKPQTSQRNIAKRIRP